MASEKMAQRPQSSYDDYVSTLQKIAPQLRSLLTQLNNEQVIRGGATSSDVDCVGGAGALEASSSHPPRKLLLFVQKAHYRHQVDRQPVHGLQVLRNSVQRQHQESPQRRAFSKKQRRRVRRNERL